MGDESAGANTTEILTEVELKMKAGSFEPTRNITGALCMPVLNPDYLSIEDMKEIRGYISRLLVKSEKKYICLEDLREVILNNYNGILDPAANWASRQDIFKGLLNKMSEHGIIKKRKKFFVLGKDVYKFN